jgi:hypothetical protein
MNNLFGYIQIYKSFKKNLTPSGIENTCSYKILITCEEYFLNKLKTNNNSIVISEIKNIEILDTFRIEFHKLLNLFKHGRDINLEVDITDKIITVVGDSQLILFSHFIPVDYNIDKIQLKLAASNDFLNKNGLPPFRKTI